MGYLNGPRINFWGGGHTNVDTANNTGNGIVDPVSASVISDDTDQDLIDELLLHDSRDGENYYTKAGWNYYGDHQVAFMDAKVSSCGHPGAVGDTGDVIGLPVYLLGSVDPQSGEGPYGGPVMVDLDATSSITTRIYVGGLQIGSGVKPALLVREDTHCHSHFLGLRYDKETTKPPHLSPGSAFANGTFQVGFHKDSVAAYDGSIPILKDIVEAPGAIGIVLRFSMFEFMPGMSTDEVQANYKNNFNDANPSLGRIIGTIGPWFAGEPATCPSGRLLQNSNLGGAQGLAHLDVANGRLSLDLVSALQGRAIRSDAIANTAPIGPNVDYGNLKIGTASAILVDDTPSLPDTYYVFGGIYDVSLSAGQAKTLSEEPIVISSSKNDLDIQESRLRVLSNDRNIYIDDVGGKTTISLQVYELGAPVKADVELSLSTAASGTIPDAKFLSYPPGVKVSAGEDNVSFKVSDNGGDAGYLSLNVSVGNDPAYFVNFRKYPQVDYSTMIQAGNIPWDTVYEKCLRYFYILFPAMSKRIPLNDESTVQAVASEFLKRTSEKYRSTTLYMPLTRALSPGKVALLRAYLKQSQQAE